MGNMIFCNKNKSFFWQISNLFFIYSLNIIHKFFTNLKLKKIPKKVTKKNNNMKV